MATIIRGDYARLSRGKHCAKHVPTGEWAERNDAGDLILDKPGRWMLHTSDGFSRKTTIYITLDADCNPTTAFGSREKFSFVS